MTRGCGTTLQNFYFNSFSTKISGQRGLGLTPETPLDLPLVWVVSCSQTAFLFFGPFLRSSRKVSGECIASNPQLLSAQLLIGLKHLLIGVKSWKPHMALCRWLDEFEKLAIMQPLSANQRHFNIFNTIIMPDLRRTLHSFGKSWCKRSATTKKAWNNTG